MGKFKENMLVKAAKEEKEKQEEQERLRTKHHVEDEDVLIVEKPNLIKFLIRCGIRLVHVSATILIIILAAIGLIALIYPEIREVLMQVLERILQDAKHMISVS